MLHLSIPHSLILPNTSQILHQYYIILDNTSSILSQCIREFNTTQLTTSILHCTFLTSIQLYTTKTTEVQFYRNQNTAQYYQYSQYIRGNLQIRKTFSSHPSNYTQRRAKMADWHWHGGSFVKSLSAGFKFVIGKLIVPDFELDMVGNDVCKY